MSKKYESSLGGFISRAEATLEAHKRLTERGLVRLPGTPTQFEVTNAYLDVSVSMLDGLVERSRFFILKPIFTQISRDYRSRNGYTSITDERISEYTGASETTLKRLRPVLLSAGIWGKVSGQGHTATRYYPLLTESGYRAFVKLVEDAKKGIHPLYGLVTDEKNADDGKPQLEAFKASPPVPEAVAASSEDLPKQPLQLDTAPAVSVPLPVAATKPAEPIAAVTDEPAPVPQPESEPAPKAPVSAPTKHTAEINPITGRPYKIAKPRAANPMTKHERAAIEEEATRKAKESAPDVLTNGSGVASTSLPEGQRRHRIYVETL